jgi:DNA-binding LacI/PurR family transcriptional regulator
MSTQVDGLVLASSRLSDEQILHATGQLPVVLANRQIAGVPGPDDRLSQVVIDVRPGFRAAVAHLHALGHRQLTYVDGPSRSWSAAQKRRALEGACTGLGVVLTVVRCERPDFAAGRRVGDHILQAGATAVLAYNDQVALGLLSACRDAGVDVPTALSVVGCDDALPEGMASPALTTIDCSSRTLGVLAATAILHRGGVHEPAAVPSRLVVRASTGRSASCTCPAVPQPRS